jgi:uncharacterized membrane protein YcaP (DUF421 family)
MNPVLRSVIMFAVLWVVFRIAGRRTLAEITTFDFILLLIIGDATQQALIGDDYSVMTAVLVIVTLVLLDVFMGRLAITGDAMRRIVESAPVIVVDKGKPLDDVLRAEGVDLEEVMAAAREKHGLQTLDDIKYAIVERHGGISIVPADDAT